MLSNWEHEGRVDGDFTPPGNDKARISAGLVLYGAGTRSRTRDLLITSQLLYQLSYTGF